MTDLPKRLIEVDLPIRRISEHARREKSIRHGHISTLHIWWARRPLAACRAVLCASLWPDPADPNCPEAFIAKAKEEMQNWTAHERQQKLSAHSRERFNAARKNTGHFEDLEELRMALLDFIADFANWDNSTDGEYLATARALTQSAHEALGGIPGTRPLVVDPFAGGGSIPLEALRVGGDAFASDLNPIPVLLNKIILEYIPKYGQRLADDVRKWGKCIREEAERELAEFYPKDEDGSTPLAYLWARTIISEDPAQGDPPIEIPILGSMWLCKKANRKVALRWRRDAEGVVQTITVEKEFTDGKTIRVRQPLLEVYEPDRPSSVDTGTVARAKVTCPITGYTISSDRVKKQLRSRSGGATDARLIAVISSRANQSGRFFRLATDSDIIAANSSKNYLKQNSISILGDSPSPKGGGKGAARAFSQQAFGMLKWSDFFTDRQLATLNGLSGVILKVFKENADSLSEDYAKALATVFFIALDRVAVRCTANCIWDSTTLCIMQLFNQGQAIPMRWEFAEMCPLSSDGSGWDTCIDYIAKVIEHNISIEHAGSSLNECAQQLPLPDISASAVVTDPPYYDAVPYADLSSFFYALLRANLCQIGHSDFSRPQIDKSSELIVDDLDNKDVRYYESGMRDAMAESLRVLSREGIGTVVFANKTTAGWEALLSGLVQSGWTLTASWPIDTESGNRLRAQNSAALASSVHLVVRPRIVNGHGAIGDWRDVLDELPKRIHAWLPRLAEEGVVGADAIFACLGPALEIFSRYDRVEKASGEQVTLREYLEHIWAAVSREALSSVVADADLSGFEPDARLTAMWLWTVAATPGGAGDSNEFSNEEEDEEAPKAVKVSGFALEYDAARKIAQGLGANLDDLKSVVEIKGDKATLLSVAQRTPYLFGKGEAQPTTAKGRKKKSNQLDLFAELIEDGASEEEWGEKTVGKPGETVLDRVHQSMILFASGRGDALKRFLVEDGAGQDPGLWKLAQALSALYPTGTQEKRWVDGVLARKKGLGL